MSKYIFFPIIMILIFTISLSIIEHTYNFIGRKKGFIWIVGLCFALAAVIFLSVNLYF